MRYIVVDDEELSLMYFRNICSDLEKENEINYFSEPFSALKFTEEHPDMDIAFLDIEMPGINGIELARSLRKINEDISIIFITGHDNYARQAFSIHADGFISKPFDVNAIRAEIKYLKSNKRHLTREKAEHTVRVQCFGHFEVFVNKQPVVFSLKKAKELLAYLVDRQGSAVSTNQIIAILWEDDCNDDTAQSRFRKTVRNLRLTLENYSIQEIFNNGRNNKSINTDFFSCDYYDFLKGESQAREKFVGEYMSGYYWGEETLAALQEKSNNFPAF